LTAVEYAVKMEIDGERYYLAQAELHKDNGVAVVSRFLAEAERSHAQLLRDWMDRIPYSLENQAPFTGVKNIFSDLGDFRSEIKVTPSQLDFYRAALELEQKSIDLYAGFLAGSEDPRELELFRFLVGEENRHFALLDELVTMLRHAEEWVESAEFGLRNETY
jgi:rubrerythrin